MPALPHIVLVRCRDSRTDSPRLLEQLRARNATFVVYQKNSSRCNRDPGLRPHEVVTLSHNKGDECSGYLRYIGDEYDRLPESVAFVQMDSARQLFVGGGGRDAGLIRTLLTVAEPLRTLGFVALSEHSFEGAWPAPCESRYKLTRFASCSARFWQLLQGDAPPPARLRFYANSLFAVTRARIRQRSRGFYVALAAQFEGKANSTCDGPDTRSMGPLRGRKRVGDCHLLEKTWHVLFGEAAEMPPPLEYNPQRAPALACPRAKRMVDDGRFELRPEERCAAALERPPGCGANPQPLEAGRVGRRCPAVGTVRVLRHRTR